MSEYTKAEFRQKILDRINNQEEKDALRKSRVICDKLTALPVFQNARTILFYASCKGEVDTFEAMNRAMDGQKRVVLPVVVKETQRILPIMIRSIKELRLGTYGIPEPTDLTGRAVEPHEIDLVVVPGVAFDRANNRLGRGKGYYDRFLSLLSSTTPTVGLAFDFQVVEALPGLMPYDRPVTHVLTN